MAKIDMLLCYMPVQRGGEYRNLLCLVPDKSDSLSSPVPVDELAIYTAAVFRVGAEEAFTTSLDEKDGQLVITALEPSFIYLTPNLSQLPGFRARKVKILPAPDGSHRTYYMANRGSWDEWVANRERK